MIFIRLYCATEVDSKGVMVPDKWGYCASTCGYCGGFPIDGDNSTRQQRAACGYDCLFNPKKTMGGSKWDYYKDDIYSGANLHEPTAYMFNFKSNFINSDYNQWKVKTFL